MLTPSKRSVLVLLSVLAVAGCGSDKKDGAPGGSDLGPPITRAEAQDIPSATGWTWVPFADAFCTDAVADSTTGRYTFGSSTTGLAISWGSEASTDLVIFLQGGGACWDYVTCGGLAPLVDKLASTGPFGPTEFARDIYAKYPESWVHREKLPASMRDATIVFVPYCTGDIHGGNNVKTYASLLPGGPSITWHHVGQANVTAFLRRLVPTFPSTRKLVVGGASAGGFGSVANYTAIRARWPQAKGYLVDDSGPLLQGDAIPASRRAEWYSSWNLGASIDPFCPECRSDMSAGMRAIERLYPADRVALISHLQDEVIRGFFGTITFTPPYLQLMPPAEFETALRALGTQVMDPATTTAKYFFTATPSPTAHPTLENPGVVTTPAPGLPAWLELMLSDSASWASAADPTPP
jgi:hypothetical protein